MFRNKFIKFFMLSISLLMLPNPFASAMRVEKRTLNIVFYGEKSNGKTFFIKALCGYNGEDIYIGDILKEEGNENITAEDYGSEVGATEVGYEYSTYMEVKFPNEESAKELELSIHDTEGGAFGNIECSECIENADIIVMTVKINEEDNQGISERMRNLYNSFVQKRNNKLTNARGNSIKFIFLCTMADKFIENSKRAQECPIAEVTGHNMFKACERSIGDFDGTIDSCIGTVIASVRMNDINDGSDNERMSLGVNRFKGLIDNLVHQHIGANYYYKRLSNRIVKKPLAPSYMFNRGYGRRSEGYGKKKTSLKGSFS
ncbi:MAG: hypothetical protein ACI35S_04530 [Anaeroplasma sp.]